MSKILLAKCAFLSCIGFLIYYIPQQKKNPKQNTYNLACDLIHDVKVSKMFKTEMKHRQQQTQLDHYFIYCYKCAT